MRDLDHEVVAFDLERRRYRRPLGVDRDGPVDPVEDLAAGDHFGATVAGRPQLGASGKIDVEAQGLGAVDGAEQVGKLDAVGGRRDEQVRVTAGLDFAEEDVLVAQQPCRALLGAGLGDGDRRRLSGAPVAADDDSLSGGIGDRDLDQRVFRLVPGGRLFQGDVDLFELPFLVGRLDGIGAFQQLSFPLGGNDGVAFTEIALEPAVAEDAGRIGAEGGKEVGELGGKQRFGLGGGEADVGA
ncbi:MAG: hypothetical protein ACJ76B_03060 [Solirubrobacterales bacterium]